MHNAHLHLDRIDTFDDRYVANSNHRISEDFYVSLQKKHSLINNLHAGPAYEPEDLTGRVSASLDLMEGCNTSRADTMIDVTADRVGTSALELMLDIKHRRANQIDLRLAAYSPFGFKDSEPHRWDVFVQGTLMADFIGCLPEADDLDDYPDHIGFDEHCRRMLELAGAQGKMLHVHTDQRNEPTENGTERLIAVMRETGGPTSPDGEPMVWAVHMISPSTYGEERHKRLIEGLLECNIGVISCPSAAIGMRQLRPISSPTYNSIPRVLELLAAGVHVRLGSDNVADICSPSTTADLMDEIFVLSGAVRYYQIDILAKLAAGKPLSADERDAVSEHLAKNQAEIERLMAVKRHASG